MATPPTVVAGETIAVSWGNAVRDWAAFGEVDGSNTAGSTALTGTAASVCTVTLTIPAGWLSWKCAAWASYYSTAGVGNVNEIRLQIDGTDQEVNNIPGDQRATTIARRSGMTTTGSRTVVLRAREASGTAGSLNEVFVYAQAMRLT